MFYAKPVTFSHVTYRYLSKQCSVSNSVHNRSFWSSEMVHGTGWYWSCYNNLQGAFKKFVDWHSYSEERYVRHILSLFSIVSRNWHVLGLVFLQSSDSVATRHLPWDITYSLKIIRSHGGYGPTSNTWFLWPTRVHNSNSISIGSAIFAGLVLCQTNRLTDGQTMLLCL